MLSPFTDDILCPWKILSVTDFQNAGWSKEYDRLCPQRGIHSTVKIINIKFLK